MTHPTGELVVAAFSLLSILALALLVLRLAKLVAVTFLRPDSGTRRPPELLFFRTQLGHYAGCLILSNLLICIAELIDLRPESPCSAEAVLMQIGLVGTSWFTIALGVHTLSILVFHIRQPRWRVLVVIAIGWMVAFIAGLVPLRNNVYGPDGPFCGVVRAYPDDIFALEVLPIILAAFVSTTVYSIIFLVLGGKLSMNSIQILQGTNRRANGFEEYHSFISLIVWTMSWFPFAFVLLLLPFCITHVLLYAGHSVSSASSVFTNVCVALLGFVNVGLLCNTFRVIGSACCGSRSTNAGADTVKTFGNDASGESPIDPHHNFSSQSTIPSYGSNHQTRSPTPPPPNHSRDPSWLSVTSNTKLLGADKNSGIVPPPDTKTRVQSEIVPPCGPSLDSRIPRVTFAAGDTLPKHSTPSSFHPEESAAPHLPVMSFPLPSEQVPNKSRAIAASYFPSVHNPPSTLTTIPGTGSDLVSRKVMNICEVRPLPQLPKEAEQDIVDSCPTLECVHTQNQRASLSTIWSQETGHTMSPFPDTQIDAAWRQPTSSALVSVGEQRRAVGRLPGPRSHSARPKTLDLTRAVSNPKMLNVYDIRSQ